MVLGGGGGERMMSGSSHGDMDSLSSAFEGVALTGSAEDGANPGRTLPLRSTPGRKAKAQSKIFGQGGDGSRAPFKNLNVPKLIAKTEPAHMSDVAISPHAMAHQALLSGTTAQASQRENMPEPASPVLDSAVAPSSNDEEPVNTSPSGGFSLFRAAMGIASSVASAVSSNSAAITSPSLNFQVPSPQEAGVSSTALFPSSDTIDPVVLPEPAPSSKKTPATTPRSVRKATISTPSRSSKKAGAAATTTLVMFDDIFLQHKTGKLCQECPQRLDVLCGPKGTLMQKSDFEELEFESHLSEAPLSDILRVHNWEYISELKRLCSGINDADPKANPVFLDPPGHPQDTQVSAMSYKVAATAAGACCAAVDRVMKGEAKNCFVACRPPGHHAGPSGLVHSEEGAPSESQGFCLLNNVAIAAAYAKYNYRDSLKKIAIIDIDVHNGDGTAGCVKNLRPHTQTHIMGPMSKVTLPSYKPWLGEGDADDVFFSSIHLCAADFYPRLTKLGMNHPGLSTKTYEPETNGYSDDPAYPNIVNIPMHRTTNTKECSALFRSLVTDRLLPRLREFAPELVIISAGFDGHTEDIKGNKGWCHLLEEDYEWVTAELCKVGKEYASGRVVSVLEGGYHVERQAGPPPKSRAKKAAAAATGSENTPGALATSCAAHVSALMRA